MNKSLSRVQIKDADQGTVEAVFSTFDVVDSDGDVTRKGAFTDGQAVVISAYGHKSWDGVLPVGSGHIEERGNEAVFKGQFFMDTQHGRDTFSVVKQLSDDGLQEWSYSLHDVKAEKGQHDGKDVRFLNEIRVKEVSPVLMGAGINTRTLAAKSAMRFSEHITAVVADVEQLVKRAQEVMALRAEKGKGLSDESAELLRSLRDSAASIDGLLNPEPSPNAQDQVAREYARLIASQQGA